MPAQSMMERLRQNNDLIAAALIIGIILIIIIPMPPGFLDFFLITSITVSIIILLITMFTTDSLQFSIFPTLLLITTLYRLALNISSTRLILSAGAAGNVIDAFGNFVTRGNYVVGLIVFIIITIIQFLVITSGAGRVAEVAARFTLDAMPGKQMSIDADYNSGLITEEEARERRRRLQREADFFGAMDGASKFVRGDAIAGIIIIFINIIGGFIIGVVQMEMQITEALQTFTILTVGDGLVGQVPALLISTASGILVTRSASEANLGAELSQQMLNFPRVLYLASGILFVLGLIPAMPNILFLFLAAGVGFAGYITMKEEKKRLVLEQQEISRQTQEQRREPENVLNYFQVDPMEIEIGYNLISLTDESQGGDLLQRVAAVRRQCALETGIFVRPIRIRDNIQLGPNSYVFKLKGNTITGGELMPGYFLAMDPAGLNEDIPGIPTTEPTFGLSAWWVEEAKREQVELLGLTVVDCSTVLITHLTEFIKQHAAELLGRQEVKDLLDLVKENNPVVVEELVPNLLTMGEIQKVLQNLLKEKVPIRDLTTILESLSDSARYSKESDFLTENARQALGRTICQGYLNAEQKLSVITLHPKLEQVLTDSVQETQLGVYPVLEPQTAQQVLGRVNAVVERVMLKGINPVVLCSARARLPFRRLTERVLPNLAVISVNEIYPGLEVEAVGTVMLD
ncbi:flagellar biosynthesis protein FlhA [Desulfolucanica intricata]|uniref:flagellar biosynthesis protein FlhA n=1 Tax=Desulfolucanica intricata TaxID=1285191 RepID=UPI0008319D62|nr:flagellar biosynthesis protein FlhA [Desulfolucanica intricata]